MFDRTEPANRLLRPAGVLAMALVVAVAFLFVPQRWTSVARSYLSIALRPGQMGAASIRHHGQRFCASLQRHWHTADQLAAAERKLETLREENGRLHSQLTTTRAVPNPDPATTDNDRLLLAQCVPANVLGREARAFLGRQHLLDQGAPSGIEPGELVLDNVPPTVDRGADAQLEPGRLVLSRNRVWGKIVDVGRYTSTVCTVTEPGFRDLVCLGTPGDASNNQHRGPQGILEGTGEPLARIRLVEATEPVAVGDPVYTLAGEGVLPEPLLCGHVARAEHAVGATHWEIWMQPAVQPQDPERVAVLHVKLNPLRVAERIPRNE